MAAPRGRGLRPGGVVRALGRLVLLVAVGFGVGLVFGLVTEEPELLARHLRGETESVALEEPGSDSSLRDAASGEDVYATAATEPRPLVEPGERAETEALPQVAAPARRAVPAASGDASPLVRTASKRPAAARETRVGASRPIPESARRAAPVETSSRSWAIQVGAFSEKRAARRLAETLSSAYPVEVLPATREGGRWRVRVQPIVSKDRAREMAERLKREEGLPTWVTPMDDGRGRAEGRSG